MKGLIFWFWQFVCEKVFDWSKTFGFTTIFYVYPRLDTNNCIVLCFRDFWQSFGPFLKKFNKHRTDFQDAYMCCKEISLLLFQVWEKHGRCILLIPRTAVGRPFQRTSSLKVGFIFYSCLTVLFVQCWKKCVLSVHICNLYKEKVLLGCTAYTVL
jgi:hypothetical protein